MRLLLPLILAVCPVRAEMSPAAAQPVAAEEKALDQALQRLWNAPSPVQQRQAQALVRKRLIDLLGRRQEPEGMESLRKLNVSVRGESGVPDPAALGKGFDLSAISKGGAVPVLGAGSTLPPPSLPTRPKAKTDSSSYSVPLSIVPLSAQSGDKIERRGILDRAQSLLGIPYKFGADSLSGMDCSAFVSRAWNVDRQGTSTIGRVSYQITKDELQPGDALNLTINKSATGYGHIRLFVGWADKDHKQVWVCEEAGAGGSSYHKVAWSDKYQPIRRKDLPRDVPAAT